MATHHQGTPDEVQALNAFISLMRASDSFTALLKRGLADQDLSHSQFGILETLMHLGPLCQKDLADKLLVSGGNITLVVDNLEKRGLVVRERQVEDRRLITVSLTPAGRKLIAATFPKHLATIVAHFAILTPAEQEALRRLCRTLGTQTRNKRRSHG
jgi:MarR family transcriptional regulator, 2-MHQ and catechol-resistance regulon repressor